VKPGGPVQLTDRKELLRQYEVTGSPVPTERREGAPFSVSPARNQTHGAAFGMTGERRRWRTIGDPPNPAVAKGAK
jgi:hypothetical protein